MNSSSKSYVVVPRIEMRGLQGNFKYVLENEKQTKINIFLRIQKGQNRRREMTKGTELCNNQLLPTKTKQYKVHSFEKEKSQRKTGKEILTTSVPYFGR